MTCSACGSGSGGRRGLAAGLPGDGEAGGKSFSSAWQARQGVQPFFLAASTGIFCRSLSPMNRIRMQLSRWYRGTPGTTVTG